MILVTGGAGYIGSHLVKRLQDQNKEVVVFDNFEKGHKWAVKDVQVVEGDLRNEKDIDYVFENYKIDEVYHFAAFSLVGESMKEPYKYFKNNICGTLNLLNSMQKHKSRYIVFSSTAAVYGEPEKVPITEDQPKNPTNIYGQSKLMIEDILNWYSKLDIIRYVALRYFNAAGAYYDGSIGEAHEPETHLIPLVLETALGKRDKLYVYGNDYPTKDGTPVRDYIHVMDLIEAHILAMKWMKENEKSDVFNLGNGQGFTVLEVIKTAEKVTSKKINYEVVERRPGDPAVLIASSKKAEEVLNWHPQNKELEKIILDAWNWHKNKDKNVLGG
ncbi:UDP-galactose-4-epimerase [Petrotoga sp. 8T1HF07.NaAc.6.1]|uniref:UDP-glucose 4-epimerase GalE n=1 Tax=Petrotoga sp. 8T1HF07.NaAc.6.1 TaxID=1351838 RepID=UPI00192BFA09|nr:UDP-glucose 4-epimerase GalE [Petrotoga sp. 8T1HF07.NaAc.6.1]MBL5980793.1 UDP-galactose-4-epimerase [Petrotoga sp. 8T1HF07.NaAc.6.1]